MTPATDLIDASTPAAYWRLLAADASPEPLADVAGIILAAGRGRRLGPLTDVLPKPLLPVLRLPMMLWGMNQMHRAGIASVRANICHLPEAFERIRDICGVAGPSLRLVVEECLTGPLGGVLSCRADLPRSRDYVIMSGDALTDIDLRALVVRHRAANADLTVAVQNVADASRFGVVTLDSGGRVLSMREKPEKVNGTEDVNVGVYVMSHDLLTSLTRPAAAELDFVDLIGSLIARGRPPIAYRHSGYWSDLGTREALRQGNLTYLSTWPAGIARRLRTTRGGEVWGERATPLPADIRVRGRVLLGPDVTLGSRVTLEDCVIGSGCELEDGVTIRRSVALSYVRTMHDQRVEDQVLAP